MSGRYECNAMSRIDVNAVRVSAAGAKVKRARHGYCLESGTSTVALVGQQ